ncbi:MAG: BadF/BadG/BcrA/BcrD ATPase family protein [Gemmatimonadales bacterium]
MTAHFVGVDVGGTKTTAVVGSATEVLSRANGPGAAVRPGRALASAQTIAEVARKALAASGQLSAAVLVVGAAGAGRAPEREELELALVREKIADKVKVTTDIELALVAAFEQEPGIVLSAGTGSIALARDATGATHRAGGYGWQMGDEGSGYGIGRSALGAVSRHRTVAVPPPS